MENGFIWDAYLLKRNLVLTLREKGTFLKTMSHDSIVKLKLLGPVPVTAPNHYKARKEFYKVLSSQDWYKKNYAQYNFTSLLPYIYVKNRIDERFHPKLDWNEFTKSAKKYEGVFE